MGLTPPSRPVFPKNQIVNEYGYPMSPEPVKEQVEYYELPKRDCYEWLSFDRDAVEAATRQMKADKADHTHESYPRVMPEIPPAPTRTMHAFGASFPVTRSGRPAPTGNRGTR